MYCFHSPEVADPSCKDRGPGISFQGWELSNLLKPMGDIRPIPQGQNPSLPHLIWLLPEAHTRRRPDRPDLTDLTERVLRDWTLPRGRNQSIYFTSEERVWQEAFKLDFSPYSSWISVPCAVNNLFNGTLQPSSLAWTTPDTLKGHGEGPTLSEAELLGTGAYASQALEIAPASGPQLPTLENIMKTSEKEGPALRLLSVATHPGQTGRRGPGSALPSLHSIQGGALDLWPDPLYNTMCKKPPAHESS
ncbi:uncharacterized protein LOC102151918 isoform X17 [Canis lupus familiaris]|uniref:uncharacterized protein LOC102151918 isoform X17 n=1 Tax=Canis lupus familiaris TaxID=9615 RepID=UPI0018F76B37|nr:uncharacterized protein LOC102151918 isoform X17 [Canis lupus familiaris]